MSEKEKEGLTKIIDSAITYASVLLVMVFQYTICFFILKSLSLSSYAIFVMTDSIFVLIGVMILDICAQIRKVFL